MKRSQLAINSVSTKYTTLPEILDAYRDAGFRNVEFCLPHVYDYLKLGHTLADARKLLDARGLRCVGGFEGGVLCFADDTKAAENHARHVENAKLLHALGGPGTAMVVGTDGPTEPREADQVIDQIAKTFATLGQKIADYGVTICIEFNWSPVVKSIRTAAEIVRRSNSANVGVLFDPAHYHCTPSKLEHLTPQNIKTIRHVHVDDMADKPGELSNCNADRVLPGKGCLDLKTLFGRLELNGYNGLFSIEMFSNELWAMAPKESAKRMYESLIALCQD